MDAHTLDCLDFPRIRELLGRCASTGLGRGLCETIRPATRGDLIRRWLAQVEELRGLDGERGLPPFAGLTDVREVVRSCAPPLRVTVEDVARIGDALEGTHNVAEYLRELPEACVELRHLRERIGDFRSVAERIRAVIDERGLVRDDASPKIRRVRGEIDEVSRQIHETVEKLLHEPPIRRLLQYPNHTFHNDRLVLPLRTECRGRLPGIVHRTSDSGATLYVEPAQAVELNNQISNLRSEEQEEINRLLWELAHEVYLNAKTIIGTLDAIAVLDLIAAKVRFAKQFGLTCPQLSEQGVLRVRGARHPVLLEQNRAREAAGESPPPVVPIDYRLGEDFDLLIITGPNTGGKTVTLKTVGLLSLMGQSGIPIPADPGAELPAFHGIYIDIGDEQSLQQSLSTFSAHLTRQLDMLRRAGPQTLLLFDELGAGTDPDEGAAIGRAILDDLLRLRARCIVTTHLGALKGVALTRPRAENGRVEFDVETLRPTYHLRIGEAGTSNAIEIAQRLGMSRRLVEAARFNLSRKARALRAAIAGTDAAKRQAEDARRAAEAAKADAARAAGAADAAKARLEAEQAAFQAWLQRVVHLQPGDACRVRHVDTEGKVVRVRLEKQRADVAVGAMLIEVPLGDLLPPDVPAPPPRAPRPPRPQSESRPREPRAPQGPPASPRPPRGRDGHGPRERGRPPGTDRRLHDGARPPGGDGARPPRSERHEPRPELHWQALSDEAAAALTSGAQVIAKRFHRPATVVRVNATRKVALVTVGLLEVELPFSGLALPAEPPRAPALQKMTTPSDGAAAVPPAPAPEAIPPVETPAAAGPAAEAPAAAATAPAPGPAPTETSEAPESPS